ncbi:hypothetical protein M011DRAFT_22267 [Sporormia fimetaria CBS 119925]|uniref:Uncharacterized protein n=1 Tax=Sporormia fimetaria CBS 119925 TaxID=1340428 RepID=A0A6A6VQD7_9PLEO|nr:hypothetical protein M011DRAFT_22267 [Sporormia fimetaria CBS 119925]
MEPPPACLLPSASRCSHGFIPPSSTLPSHPLTSHAGPSSAEHEEPSITDHVQPSPTESESSTTEHADEPAEPLHEPEAADEASAMVTPAESTTAGLVGVMAIGIAT